MILEKINEPNDIKKIDKRIDELDRAIFEHKNQISEKEDEVRSNNEEEAKVDNKIYSLNSVITSLVTKDNFYRGLKENYEGYSQAVKLLLNKESVKLYCHISNWRS